MKQNTTQEIKNVCENYKTIKDMLDDRNSELVMLSESLNIPLEFLKSESNAAAQTAIDSIVQMSISGREMTIEDLGCVTKNRSK